MTNRTSRWLVAVAQLQEAGLSEQHARALKMWMNEESRSGREIDSKKLLLYLEAAGKHQRALEEEQST